MRCEYCGREAVSDRVVVQFETARPRARVDVAGVSL